MHGISASVSAASSNGGGPPVPPSALAKHRYSSRSNSISSSSVVTVKRTGSLSSSSTGARHSAMPMRPQSPGETSLIALRVGRDHMVQDHKRRKSVAVDASNPGETEGLNNLNRCNDTESPSTIRTITTPSTHSSYLVQDYFGDDGISPRNKAKDKRPVVIRNHTAPMSAVNHMRTPVPEAPREPLRRARTSDKREHEAKPSDGSARRGSRTRNSREKDKKAMLSKALQKANTAVLLDNAQNFEGALEAYTDACRLLQHVMDRSSAADDKRKLEAIKVTYSNRIEELEQLDMSRPPTADEKNLPARPMSDESMSFSPRAGAVSPIDGGIRDSTVIETATMTRIVDLPRLSYPKKDRDSFFSRTIEAVQSSGQEESRSRRKETSTERGEGLPFRSEEGPEIAQQTLLLPALEDRRYMPAPLSPRKPPSPLLKPEAEESWQGERELQSGERPRDLDDVPDANENAGSWLDTIDESSSCRSSVHSVSVGGLRRKHIRGNSGATDPDLHAAFDAAVEAAYDEGLEPDLEASEKRRTAYLHAAKESVTLPSPDIKEVLSPTNDFRPAGSLNSLDLDDDEEERLLDEITSDYAQGFNFDLSSKSALPRQSDSSGYSRSTWQSSQASADRNTAATSLSTVAEDTLSGRFSPNLAEAQAVKSDPLTLQAPPPSSALPRPPSMSGNRLSSVRSRRLSGQSGLKQLKIETSTKADGRKRASTYHHSPSSAIQDREREGEDFNKDFKFGVSLEATNSEREHEHILTSPPSLDMRSVVQEPVRPVTAAVTEARRSLDDSPGELRSSRPTFFRKNKSSVSLRDNHALLSSPEDSAPSLATPMSSTFMSFASKRSDGPLLTSQRANFQSFDSSFTSTTAFQSGGAYLFDTSLSSSPLPTSPRSPTFTTQPLGLEPCPESFLLRPFWLMRAIASTLTHPKGGFLTTRVFVPREVWQTRGVKLKSLEDKVANCDLLTAALGRLAGVDTYDADAVMEELQSFEEVMEREASSGAGGAASGSTGSHTEQAAAALDAVAGAAEKASKSREGKGYLTSWRKLRNKSSGTPLTTSLHQAGGRTTAAGGADREGPALSLASVPMTSFVPVERRGAKREVRKVRKLVFEGPQREYMGSLARLFEGAQVLVHAPPPHTHPCTPTHLIKENPRLQKHLLTTPFPYLLDQIARQVEDPGFKHSSPTHVGLELSIRHAAEFFAFYICRFVLADLGTLLDKFVKRGTEWVLA
ncbi:hypothetical protein B0A55_00786 [Friedmanniomyces simplex]|uniref:MIT domain-containing protein n=1 Tax=Friedmanniomyces simplex TaxID=329884 RepID=A0A4U0XZ12_9PEZI|nr:hypothetical protein B0A55_00786 [Friedmanniomyces simplex]